ncbi:MAG TPA: hypothetical protein VN903_26085 [Polyangia bacterium]|jgi:hypothetical protein|nr:hypothetical protein [Polyangia bacterium]
MDYFADTLNDIEMAGGLTNGFDNASRFMIEVCNKIALPEHAKESLKVAARYVKNEASAEDLETVLVRCWQSIDGRTSEFTDPKVAAIRAVICTLYPRDRQSDLFTTLGFFRDCAVTSGISSDDLLAGLRRAFGVAAQPAVVADGASPRR